MPDKDHRAAHADEGSELDGGGGGIVEVSGDCRRGEGEGEDSETRGKAVAVRATYSRTLSRKQPRSTER
jgi:hypothetical protein